MGRSVRLKSFELVARDIREVDVKLLHALSIAVGWPHRPKDWDFLRRAGQGIVAVDGIGRVFGSAMWFPHGREVRHHRPGNHIAAHPSTRYRPMADGTGVRTVWQSEFES